MTVSVQQLKSLPYKKLAFVPIEDANIARLFFEYKRYALLLHSYLKITYKLLISLKVFNLHKLPLEDT